MNVGDLVTCIYQTGVGIVTKNLGRRKFLVYWPNGYKCTYWERIMKKVKKNEV